MKYTFEIMKEYEDAFRGISVYSVSEDKKLMVDFVALEELEDAQKEIDEAYQRGLDDAWEAARKISVIELNGGLRGNELMKIYGTMDIHKIYDDNTASEAIEKLKAYEEQKADGEIKVGDTVNIKGTSRKNGDGIVTKSWDNDRYFIMWADGTGGIWAKECIEKTGRHFDIPKILEGMKE